MFSILQQLETSEASLSITLNVRYRFIYIDFNELVFVCLSLEYLLS